MYSAYIIVFAALASCSLAQVSTRSRTDLSSTGLLMYTPIDTRQIVLKYTYKTTMIQALGELFDLTGYEHNLDGASKSIKELVTGKKPSPTSPNNENIVRALNIFALMAEAKKRCDSISFQAFSLNYQLAQDDNGDVKADTLPNLLLLEGIEEHGKLCRPNYLSRFIEKFNEIDDGLKKEVDFIVDSNIIESYFGSQKLTEVLKGSLGFSDRFYKSSELLLAKLIEIVRLKNDKIVDLAKYQDPLETIPNELRIQTKAYKYIVAPCTKFANQLADIFDPAQLDLALNVSKIWEINPEGDPSFEKTWIQYKFCGSVSDDWDHIVDKLSFAIGETKGINIRY